ncbi:MAG: hypothetical protein ACO1RX_16655 [Candidatus Sericytochromatia bacterium]
MPWKHLLLTLMLSGSLLLPAFAAPEAQIVTAEGEAALDLGVTRAREAAIAQANRLAVEQALGVYVASETLVENMAVVKDSILTKASGYVSGYKIISESKADGIYRVKLQATVSLQPLVDELAKLGLLREWTVAVVVVSNGETRPSNEAARTRLNQMVLEKGFRVADDNALVQLSQPAIMQQIQQGNYLAALPVLRDHGVDVLIVGTTLSRPAAEGAIETYAGLKTVMTQGRLDARAIRVDTGEILATQSFVATAGGSAQDIAESKAIEQAATKAGGFFVLEIARLPAATSQMVQLTVRGLVFNRERAFRDALQQIPGLSKVSRSVFRNRLAHYELDFQGKSDELAELLSDHAALKPFKLEIESVSSGQIEASAQ